MGLFLHDFTVLDFAFLSPERGLEGESFYVSAELDGELDEKGFIFDFGPAKKALKRVVDEVLDHRLAVPALHPSLKGTSGGFSFAGVEYEAPAEAVAMLECEAISVEALETYLASEALGELPKNVRSLRFTLKADRRFENEANFRYTHGLRLHEGNCQRLLHGHRNPIEVWVNGARAADWEAFLAKEWDGAHFVYAPTLVNRSELDLPLGRRVHRAEGAAIVEYGAPQGFFRAALPAGKIVLLETEPSIENIARLGVDRLRAEGMNGPLKVVAYEGLNKGASFSG